MKDIIEHGIPKHDFFAIAVPPAWIHVSIDPPPEPVTITLVDPKSKEQNKVEIIDSWVWELKQFRLMNAFSLMVYGLPALKMETILRARYPEIDKANVVRFVLLKKL